MRADHAMAIDYLAQSEKYRPAVIDTLLVGEAPPPNGKSFFYLPTTLRNTRSIRDNRSLPATIFYHYFQKLPDGEEEYAAFLLKLMERRVFLIDIFDAPIKVRGSARGLRQIVEAIPLLREKLRRRDIEVAEENIVFLLARQTYRTRICEEFPRSRYVPWIDFRASSAARA